MDNTQASIRQAANWLAEIMPSIVRLTADEFAELEREVAKLKRQA
jgi:hypothetical protein